jgi:hypothetical protein
MQVNQSSNNFGICDVGYEMQEKAKLCDLTSLVHLLSSWFT